MKTVLFYALLFISTVFATADAQTSKTVPYDVRAVFREGGCEIIIVNEAMRTDLRRQRVYVASCSGLDTYLMAVKCRGNSCAVMH